MTTRSDARGRGPVRGRRREGKILVMFALLLPALLGMVGLVIDSGLLMVAQRQAQNAADAAALAAAMDLYRGATAATATATANTFMTNNGLSGVTLTLNAGTSNAINTPPASGPHSTGSTNVQYAEAYVTRPVTTSFIQVLGVNKSQQVTARAVAGYEPVGSGEGAIVLDPTAVPGIEFKGNNAQIIVNGSVVDNSKGGGVDQYGATVTTLADGSTPLSGVAIGTQRTPSIIATDFQVVGGVDTPSNFAAYDPAFSPPYDPSNTDRPVFARAPIAPDPLLSLPTPTTSNGVVNIPRTGSENPLQPGIYPTGLSIKGTVTMSPGIYVIQGGDLSIGGNANVTGNGVMFYLTDTTYVPTTGLPDANDGSTRGSVGGATLSMTGNPTVNLSPLSDSKSLFNGMLIYQRRWNTSPPTLTGNGTSVVLSGTIYAKWAKFQLKGQGTYLAQFVVGSLLLTGNGNITINATGKNFGKANLVFLVE